MSRRYTVIGAGAVGLLYGVRLQAAGNAVTWVLPRHADIVRSSGLQIDAKDNPLHLDDVTVVDDPAQAPPADVVLVALKTTANHRLAELVGPAVAEGATVAMFQNGLGVEERLAAAVPQAGSVLAALCFVCAHRLGPGHVHHLDYGSVEVAELGATSITPAVKELASDLEAAGFETAQHADLTTARWRKLVWNIPYNGLSVVLDAATDELMRSPVTAGLVERLMLEVIAGGRACGADIADDFSQVMIKRTLDMRPYAPSMKLDHDAGRALELAAIYDAPIAAAAHAGQRMPQVEVVRDQLTFLDARSRKEPDA